MPKITSTTAVRELPPDPRIKIKAAREISKRVGSEIHWRPLNLDEDLQFAVLMAEGQ